MEDKQIRCKNCGRLFEPTRVGDTYCSALCRTTALFVGGGGDQTKPIAEGASRKERESAEARQRKQHTSKRGSDTKYPRVKQLFELPISERWKLASTFTEDEMSYARRIASRKMNEDRFVDEISSWGTGKEEEQLTDDSFLGESDDGSV